MMEVENRKLVRIGDGLFFCSRVASVFALDKSIMSWLFLRGEPIGRVGMNFVVWVEERAVSMLASLLEAFFRLMIGELGRHYFHIFITESLCMHGKQLRFLHRCG